MTTLASISSSQVQKEVTANENFIAVSPAALFGRRYAGISGLTWAFYGGILYVDGVATSISNDTVLLTDSATNYIERTRAGVVSANTSGFTAGRIPLYTAVTSGGAITGYTDYRDLTTQLQKGRVGVTVTTADVTLSAAQARVDEVKATGTLTGNRSIIVPAVAWAWIVDNATAGAFTLTVKTAAGSGVVVPQGTVTVVYCDGTDVKSALSGVAGNLTVGGTLAVDTIVSLATTATVFNTVATTVNAFGAATALTIGAATGTATINNPTVAMGGNAAAAQVLNLSAAAGQQKQINFRSNSVTRWILLSTLEAESGSDAGSNLQILARTDAGVAIDTPLTITRAAGGAISLTRPLFINDTTNANMTVGLTINGGANDNQHLCIKNSDVAHGLTSGGIVAAETDDFLTIQKSSGSFGGTTIISFCEDAANQIPMQLISYGGTADTTDTSASRGLIELIAAEHDGANATIAAPANQNVFAIRATTGAATYATRLLLKGDDGELHLGNATVAALDDTNDAVIARAFQRVSAASGIVLTEYDNPFDNYDLLRERGLVGPKDERGEFLFPLQPRLHAHEGAIWQGYIRDKAMERRLDAHDEEREFVCGEIHRLSARLNQLENRA